MRPIPQALGEQIEFFDACIARWGSGVTSPGDPAVSAAQVAELAALVAETVRARVASEQAKEAAKATTRTLHTARAAMLALGRAMVSAGRPGTGAETTPGTPAVMVETKPGVSGNVELAAPAVPTGVGVWVSAQGDVTVAWEAERAGPPTGVYFEVRRAVVEGAGSGPGSVRVFTTADLRYTDVSDLAANPTPPPLEGGVLAYQVRALWGRGSTARASAWTSLYTAARPTKLRLAGAA